MSNTQPLKIEVKDGLLSISIGADTLSKSVEIRSLLNSEKITNPLKFTEDIKKELQEELDDGTTLIHEMFDIAAENAINNGSEWVEETE